MGEFNPRWDKDSEFDHHLEGDEPVIQHMKKHLDDQAKARKAAMANYYAYTCEAIAAMFMVGSVLMFNAGETQISGELMIYGIIALAVGALFACRRAWLTTPPPEEPNI